VLTVETLWDEVENLVRITFRDNGPGIADDALSRLFDPFYTTKPEGKGTGLGLAVSYGIIQEHGGSISAGNEAGEGACFTVELPALDSPHFGESILQPLDDGPDGQHIGRVLVVDDETSILDLVQTALEGEGYTVETAAEGEEALKKLDAGSYHAVVTDLKMPGTDGIELYQRAVRKRPELGRCFLFLSGDTLSPQTRRFIESHSLRFLAKPFDIKVLRENVARLCQA
jgi:CheY-like chemotaxis protein